MTAEEYEFISNLNGILKFIIAGTGAGKTHWLINKFCNYNSKESKVLILCNRSALKDKNLKDFSKATSSIEKALMQLGFGKVSQELLKRIEFRKVDIKTYRSLAYMEVGELKNY